MAMRTATATFTGAEDYQAVTWEEMTGSFGISHGVVSDEAYDVYGPIIAWITDVTSTGCQVNVSSHFLGRVEVMAWDKP